MSETTDVREDFEGELVQVDYRDDGTIKALHAVDARGDVRVIRIELPPEPMEPIHVGQPHAVFLGKSRAIVRITAERRP